VDRATELGSQLLPPLFEFSSACAGCGETPYLKLLSQLFGDRAIIANAAGCSSVYGGHLPTTPWTTDASGRGPAWAHSLFEDNAEFGFGMRLAMDRRLAQATKLLRDLGNTLDEQLVEGLLESPQVNEAEVAAQRERVSQLLDILSKMDAPAAQQLRQLAEVFVRRSIWIVGGDAWANDIGFGGLDHVLASGLDVNVLVLDTGVCSSTGGQTSKATPRSAVARSAPAGKRQARKDLGRMAMTYGTVYTAQVALGANPAQTLRAFLDAESYGGPSLILAYSNCIAHGVSMATSMSHQKLVERSGFWPLYRYDPRRSASKETPLQLDSEKPQAPFKAFAMTEARFAMLARTNPDHARELFERAQKDLKNQWKDYRQLADENAE
jgi:pyruvate-ferredoxin/flavodoxin oxidoreductase